MAMLDRLTRELRLLRRLPGPLGDAKLVETPAILKGLGGGDAEVALNRLLLLQRQQQADHEVTAAFASIGYGATGDTVLERLDDYASSRYVDARTVRRWSDAGITKLAALILTAAPWIDPQVELRIDISDEGGTCSLRFTVPRHIGMRLPELSVDNAPLELTWTQLPAPETEPARYQSDDTPIAIEAISGCQLRLEWRGEVVPTFISEVISTPAWACRTSLTLHAMTVAVRPHRSPAEHNRTTPSSTSWNSNGPLTGTAGWHAIERVERTGSSGIGNRVGRALGLASILPPNDEPERYPAQLLAQWSVR